jgi:hypothetical protein
VYIGDSSTDFDAMCAADVGIWLCDVPELQYGSKFKETFKPLDFMPPPLQTWREDRQPKQLCYWAPNFKVVFKHLTLESDGSKDSP